jgi:hypothetical protein
VKSQEQCLNNLDFCDEESDEEEGVLESGGVNRIFYPWYFRRIADAPEPYSDDRMLRDILKNNLVLQQHLKAGDSDACLVDHFLCAEISDEDLPWDVNEIDW